MEPGTGRCLEGSSWSKAACEKSPRGMSQQARGSGWCLGGRSWSKSACLSRKSRSSGGNWRNWKCLPGAHPLQELIGTRRILLAAMRNRCFACAASHGFLLIFSSCQAMNTALSSSGVVEQPLPCLHSIWKMPACRSSHRSRSPNVPSSRCLKRKRSSLPVNRLGMPRVWAGAGDRVRAGGTKPARQYVPVHSSPR